MTFTVNAKKSVLKFIKKLNKQQKNKILNLIQTLKINPIPVKDYDITKLKGYKDTFRIRIGKIRVIYRIHWEKRKITIHFIGWRKHAYQ